MINTYQGKTNGSVTVNGKPLPKRLEIVNHSPDGFAWGYGGSGPSQLALAIMVNEFGTDLNQHPCHYHEFKDKVIAKLQQDKPFELTSTQIQQMCCGE